jgi:hypothetical protein
MNLVELVIDKYPSHINEICRTNDDYEMIMVENTPRKFFDNIWNSKYVFIWDLVITRYNRDLITYFISKIALYGRQNIKLYVTKNECSLIESSVKNNYSTMCPTELYYDLKSFNDRVNLLNVSEGSKLIRDVSLRIIILLTIIN